MRILIDALTARVGGGITYFYQALPALARQDQRIQYTVLLSSRYQSNLIETLPEGMLPLIVNLPAEPLVPRWWYLQASLPTVLKQGQFNLFLALGESSYFRIPCPFVMLVRNPSIYADLGAFGHERLQLLLHRLVRQPLVYLSMRRADRLVFVSAAFRDEVVRKMHLPTEKTRVVYHGLSPIFSQAGHLATTSHLGREPYLLTVSTINPHKNYETLLRAFASIRDSGLHLMIAGKAQHEPTYRLLQGIVEREGLQDQVRFLGHVEYERLPALYKRAVALVFPSRLETFGHPLVEAMASGTPIIASDLAVCREICQGAAVYFKPNDSAALAELLRDLMTNPEQRASLAQRGQARAQAFSWDESARRLIHIFWELE